jgi:hypothetical protein
LREHFNRPYFLRVRPDIEHQGDLYRVPDVGAVNQERTAQLSAGRKGGAGSQAEENGPEAADHAIAGRAAEALNRPPALAKTFGPHFRLQGLDRHRVGELAGCGVLEASLHFALA